MKIVDFLVPVYLETNNPKTLGTRILEFCDSCFYLGRSCRYYQIQYDPKRDAFVNNIHFPFAQKDREISLLIVKIALWLSGLFVIALAVKIGYRLSKKFQPIDNLLSYDEKTTNRLNYILMNIPPKIRAVAGSSLDLLNALENKKIELVDDALIFDISSHTLKLYPSKNDIWMLEEQQNSKEAFIVGCNTNFHPLEKKPPEHEEFVLKWLKRLVKGEMVGIIEGDDWNTALESNHKSIQLKPPVLEK